VNWRHFRTFLWLRWRLFANQLRRGGMTNVVVTGIVAALAAVVAVGAAVGLFLVGLFALADAPPAAVLYTWDGLVGAFLLFWAVGLVVELQRAEALSLEKFLHLPVSLRSAFAVNYLASLVNLCLVFFLPAMLGLAAGLVLSRGPAMLLAFPLLAAFLLAVTAPTYQFQGWLAALMANPRRRRTVIVIATMTIVLLAQLPNVIVNVLGKSAGATGLADTAARYDARQSELRQQVQAKAITQEEYRKRRAELDREFQAAMTAAKRGWATTAATVRLLNLVLPPGWLPFGAMALTEGNVLPALLGTLGLGLVGAASLWRAYRTTLRLYTGQVGGRRPPPPVTAASASVPVGAPATAAGPRLLERRLPWLSEQAAAIALAGFRGLTRAPEAKMMLLSPIILLVVFGSMFLTRPTAPSAASRPLVATGAIAMVLLSMGQLVGNQFGFDRAGFRVFVLCSARRGDILLGKNLAFAPLALGLTAVALVVLQIVSPMRTDHFLATMPQAVTMFLLYCLSANVVSILVPMPIAAGSLRPTNARMVPVLVHLAFTLTLPLVWAPALLPLGVEAALEAAGLWAGAPVALVLSVAVCAGVVALYRVTLGWQGELLQARELSVLETVTSKIE
jgi:hypothetical protein